VKNSRKEIKILNLARFIAIKGLPPENDISLKIYYYLREKYGIQSRFIKPVSKIPKWAAWLKKTLKKRREIFNNENYVDEKYNIPVKFLKESIFLLGRILNRNKKIKTYIQYKILKRELNKEIVNFKPDLIHAHTVFPDGYYSYQTYKNKGIPYIVTLRGEYNKKYESEIYRKILQNAAHIHTPSVTLYKRLNKYYPIDLQPHPLESKWFEDRNKKRFDALNLITVCRLLEMKNIDIVLKAVQILHNRGYEVTYTIVGDGRYEEELKNLTKELGISAIVSFKGYRSHKEIKDYYSKANIFVMLSRPETYGRVFFEAAAQGLVVIGSKNTGADGHLTEKEGIFIQETVDNLVHILKNTTEEEFKSISENAQKHTYQFKEDKVINQYYKIIQEAIGKR